MTISGTHALVQPQQKSNFVEKRFTIDTEFQWHQSWFTLKLHWHFITGALVLYSYFNKSDSRKRRIMLFAVVICGKSVNSTCNATADNTEHSSRKLYIYCKKFNLLSRELRWHRSQSVVNPESCSGSCRITMISIGISGNHWLATLIYINFLNRINFLKLKIKFLIFVAAQLILHSNQ